MTRNVTLKFYSTPNKKNPTRLLQSTILLILLLISFIPSAIAYDCEASNDCADIKFIDKITNPDGTVSFCFGITNNCNRALSHIAFSIPQMATYPADNSTYVSDNQYKYNVENLTNNPFTSIKYETIGEGIKNGDSDQFCFSLPFSVAQNFSVVTIEAKSSNKRYRVEIDFSDCIRDPQLMIVNRLRQKNNEDVTVYPNPIGTNNEILIVPAEKFVGQAGTVIVIDRFGQSIFQQEFETIDSNPIPFDTRLLPGGIYTVYFRVRGRKGIGKKIVISRL